MISRIAQGIGRTLGRRPAPEEEGETRPISALLRIACLALLALFVAVPIDAASVRDVEIVGDSITLRFDAPVERASAFTVDDPRRIAIDIVGAHAGTGGKAGGRVATIRQAQFDANTARVVLDLTSPAIVKGGGFSTDGRSLVLEIDRTTPAAFTRSTKAARRVFEPPVAVRAAAPKRSDRSAVRVPLDRDRAGGPPLPRVIGARGTGRPLVVIDAGHGGHDPGSIAADGRQEKDAALAIALAIRDELVESGRVRVAMTRDRDRFLVLGERREIARRLGADLFLSVHADSAANTAARGATIYTLSEVASDRVAAAVAARENRADVLNGVNLGGENEDVSSILFDLAQRETMNISADFATLLQREMATKVSFKDEFHRFAGLIVLKAPDVPSVLLETGYISNDDDAKLLFSKGYQRDVAQGVRRAVELHFARQLASN
ncbi:N-acetylmuramoyl-L-alanine amidase [Sphingomonas laterariae]|uniref:N-acetylmuramoyl-L-alanine amidase n=1 Tax=Edaphosphingomonas laterariae TaxID=861865 RepID=A0A239F2D2_9SPHN|nr:N-acetylmuramoyl-L-alanine amidase [Sphingomonas laterariae]SNS50871.1 N-acetylmuramoyl-L-alanine amidase [Sphingomonas laterariae]